MTLTRRALASLAVLAACRSSDRLAGGPTSPPLHVDRTVDLTIAVDQGRAPISRYIYGSSQDDGSTRFTVRRYGGNRLTGYNWENNFSNAGSDYQQSSDDYLIADAGLPASDTAIAARAMTYFHDQSLAMGAKSIVTLQMAGYVAADEKGTVSVGETAPSPRWVRVVAKKNAPFVLAPDRRDSVVYMDELVNVLVQKYGPASSPNGIRWYALDNEPALWPSTHPRIHPNPVGVQELLDKSIALASAVKDVDPSAGITGPVSYGFSGYISLQSAPDWDALRGSYDFFLDYYLAKMKQASDAQGRRLLDALDVHYYPEAMGDHRVTDANATTAADIAARLQAPRTLWDSSYRENSWVGQYLGAYLPVIPRLKRAIAQNYPGTQLAITEYDFGGRDTPSGGITQADVLGIFGREGVDIATAWGMSSAARYGTAAFRLYLNYDGKGGTFGNTSVRALTADTARVSIYAAVDSADASLLHVIVLNKDVSATIEARLRISGGAYTSGEVYGFDATSPTVTDRGPLGGLTAAGASVTLTPLSAVHVVLRR